MSEYFVELFTRPGCHLCDEMREVVVPVAQRLDVDLVEIDIATSDDLTRDFGLRIPVLAGSDGRILAEYRTTRAEVRKLLKNWRRAQP